MNAHAQPLPLDASKSEAAIRVNLAACYRLVARYGMTDMVANHISAIFAKLQVTDRGEAIILARDAGLGRDSRASRGSQPGARPD